MLTIKPIRIVIFILLCMPAIVGAFFASSALYAAVPESIFAAFGVILFFFFLLYAFLIATYRIFLAFNGFRSGNLVSGSPNESTYQIATLIFTLWFQQPVKTLLPVPFCAPVYRLLGARIGKDSIVAGFIADPFLVEIGDNTVLGFDSVVIPHVIEGDRMACYPVRIGSNVVVGLKTAILGGSTIEDGAIIGANSVVLKKRIVPRNEVWGGSPIRFIKKRTQAHEDAQ